MNPARAFGPDVFNGAWQYCWIYLFGPVLGIWLASFLLEAFATPGEKCDERKFEPLLECTANYGERRLDNTGISANYA